MLDFFSLTHSSGSALLTRVSSSVWLPEARASDRKSRGLLACATQNTHPGLRIVRRKLDEAVMGDKVDDFSVAGRAAPGIPPSDGRPRSYTMIEQEGGAARLSGDLLTYTGQDAVVMPSKVIRQYRHVARRIDLSYNCISSLEGLEEFKELKELVLDNNRLKDGIKLPLLPKLETLSLNKNLLCNLDPLLDSLVKKCPNVTFLSLLGNVACPNELSCSDKDEEDYRRYRHYVIFRLPKLKFLDSNPVTHRERQEAMRVGQFMRVVQPSQDLLSQQDEMAKRRSQEENSDYSPLPESLAQEGHHKGSFGVCRYVYYGRHSEGNRFIRNNDL